MARKKRGYEARLEKSALVLSHDPELPAVCMKCGKHDGITREPKMFHWRPAWSRYLLLCGIGLFIMALTTQRASLEIPLCPKCYARWSTARTVQVAGVVVIVAALAAFTLIPADIGAKRIGLAAFLATIAAYGAMNLTFVRRRMLRASAIDEKKIALLGVHPSAINEILAVTRPVSARQPLPPPTSAS